MGNRVVVGALVQRADVESSSLNSIGCTPLSAALNFGLLKALKLQVLLVFSMNRFVKNRAPSCATDLGSSVGAKLR